jgi:hypothetical protein
MNFPVFDGHHLMHSAATFNARRSEPTAYKAPAGSRVLTIISERSLSTVDPN